MKRNNYNYEICPKDQEAYELLYKNREGVSRSETIYGQVALGDSLEILDANNVSYDFRKRDRFICSGCKSGWCSGCVAED